MGRMIGGLLAAVAAAVFVFATDAERAPTISLRAHTAHVPGFRHTGNIAGAGAVLEATIEIGGSENGGFPPPLTHLALSLPPGMRWSSSEFPKCYYSPYEIHPGYGAGPSCPRGSLGRSSTANTMMSFGDEVVPESASVGSFYTPNGGLEIFLLGHEPVLLELFGAATLTRHDASPNVSLDVDLPLVETVPGAPDMSITKLTLFIGSGVTVAGRPHFSLRMPKKCDRGSLPFRVEARFGGGTQQTASARYHTPCPTLRRSG